MDLERLTCSSCGAALEIPPGVEYANCRHCGSSLRIRRTESAVFTELLQGMQAQVDQLAQNAERLQLQNDLLILDRDWERRAAELAIRGKYGHSHPPSQIGAAFVGIIGTGFGVFWTTAVAQTDAPRLMVAFGMLFIAIAIVSSIVISVKSSRYQQLQRKYQEQRADLNRRLRSLSQ